jgi:glycosyltransferase involved in cell wall biosynthesis
MIYINGKFLAQRTTGVQRFARGVIGALDQSLLSTPCGRTVELLLPPTATPIDGLKVIRQRVVGRPGRSLTVWEQLELPRHADGGTLICLSGSAPLLVNECVPTIHDAAIYLYPRAYSRAFVTWYRLLFSLRARRSPLVLTVSDDSARELAHYLPSTSYRVVPNSAEHITKQPSDVSVLERLGLEAGQFLLSVGSLNPTKNFLALINAYSTSSLADKLPLVIVGAINSDVFRHNLKSSNHPNVKWAGSLPDTQLRSLYENATVFVFPSIYEGFGIPPLEAMLCACPVVASNSSAIPEVCGDAAHYFDPLCAIDMMVAINIVIDNEAYRNSLIDKGLRRAKAFSWKNSATKLRAALAAFSIIDE